MIVGDEVVEGAAVTEAGPGPVFVFPGQGSQWHGMAVALLDEDETFARWMAEADRAIAGHVGWSVIEVLRGEAELLERIEVLQPALFAIMISLAQTWRANGVEPAAVVGHSQGEIAAAYIAGALTLDQAARIVVKRSQLFADELVGNGAVASIALPAAEVEKLLPEGLAIAGVNSPHACTVAGAVPALEKFVESCVAKDIRARVIGSTVASHCAQVDRLRDRILELFADITPAVEQRAVLLDRHGRAHRHRTLDAEYWFQNARQPVSFAKVVEKLVADGHRVLIESSAHPVLMLPAQQTAEAIGTEIVAIGSLRRDQGGDRFTTSLAEAWVAGLDVGWQYPAAGGSRCPRIRSTTRGSGPSRSSRTPPTRSTPSSGSSSTTATSRTWASGRASRKRSRSGASAASPNPQWTPGGTATSGPRSPSAERRPARGWSSHPARTPQDVIDALPTPSTSTSTSRSAAPTSSHACPRRSTASSR